MIVPLESQLLNVVLLALGILIVAFLTIEAVILVEIFASYERYMKEHKNES